MSCAVSQYLGEVGVDAVEFAHQSGPAIGYLGSAFMTDPATTKVGEPYGLDFVSFYALGRASVIGDAPPTVAAATFPFVPADVAGSIWEGAAKKLSPADAAAMYATACQDWGRRHLVGGDGLDRMAELISSITDSAASYWGPLFAGWKALPLPEDAAGRVAQLCHVVRELRGAMHVVALLSSGMTPLEALVVNGGQEGAAQFMWPEPYPDPEPLRARHKAILATTDEMFAGVSEVLSATDRTELGALFDTAMTHAQAL